MIPPPATSSWDVLGKNMEITQDYLRHLFDYDGKNLIWKVPRQKINIGDIAGYVSGNGYRYIGINKKRYLAHRLIWIYHNKSCDAQIDHIDGNRLNNSIKNLRLATSCENARNKKIHNNNTSGFPGVDFHKQRKKWRSRIRVMGKQIHLGIFDSFELACIARKEAEKKYFGEWTRDFYKREELQ